MYILGTFVNTGMTLRTAACVPDIYNLFLETKIMTVHFVKKIIANG